MLQLRCTPLVSVVNHVAARTFRERKKTQKKSFFSLNFNVCINLTWITGKELDCEININNGDQFRFPP